MGLYNKKRVKELAEEKMRKELSQYYDDLENYNLTTMSEEEFRKYYLLTQILPENILKEKWHFYTTDTIYEEIIERTDIYKEDRDGVYDTEMYLEHLLTENEICGFLELGNDLWILREY